MEEIDPRLRLKVGKMIGQVGGDALNKLGKARPAYREEIYQSLKTASVYALDLKKRFVASPTGFSVATVEVNR